jgi:hypothetical protein
VLPRQPRIRNRYIGWRRTPDHERPVLLELRDLGTIAVIEDEGRALVELRRSL